MLSAGAACLRAGPHPSPWLRGPRKRWSPIWQRARWQSLATSAACGRSARRLNNQTLILPTGLSQNGGGEHIRNHQDQLSGPTAAGGHYGTPLDPTGHHGTPRDITEYH